MRDRWENKNEFSNNDESNAYCNRCMPGTLHPTYNQHKKKAFPYSCKGNKGKHEGDLLALQILFSDTGAQKVLSED